MSASEAIASSLRVVTAPSTSVDASKSRRLSHLNALVKMWQKRDEEDIEYDGLRLHEIMLWYDLLKTKVLYCRCAEIILISFSV